MKEMTDRELTDKISQVFENFEDPDAAKGWQELRKKYPESKTKPLAFWWGAAAAVFLLVGGLWFITPVSKESPEELAKENQPRQQETVNIDKQDENILKTNKTPDRINASTDNSNDPTNVSSSKPADSEGVIASKLNSVNKPSFLESSNAVNPGRMAILKPAAIQKSTVETKQEMPSISLLKEIDNLTSRNRIGSDRDSLIDLTARMLALSQPKIANDAHLHNVENTPYSSRKTSSEKNTVSFYAGSYFNYSLGSETELNFGAGFTSDIRLTGNLRISTGLALANNSLRYNDGVPSSSKQKMAFDALPSFSAGQGTSANNNLTTVTRYDARLLALDIPINIKYLIIPQNNRLYLLAGLSSGTYLDETYSLDYRNYSSAGMYVNQTQGIEVKKQLQTFDLARTLNISFGYSSNVGKTQNITIEPFLKYPLGGLGSEDLKFGSAGINLKMNFSQNKQR